MDMKSLLASDEHVEVVPTRLESPTSSVPHKRKLTEADLLRSRESTPRLADTPPPPPADSQSQSHTPAPTTSQQPPLLPSNHILKPPTFIPTSDSGFYTTSDVPASRNYRYLPAVRSPTYDPLIDELPYYQTGESTPAGCVRVSWEDRSPFVRVSEDGTAMAGHKGFRSARLNVPIREGDWYFEVEILQGNESSSNSSLPNPDSSSNGEAHIRLGWARREASLNGPAGLDGYSYGIRDKTGEKVTLSRPRPYSRIPFSTGDIVGMYISLPPHHTPSPFSSSHDSSTNGNGGKSEVDEDDPARIVPKRTPIQYRGNTYFEASEYLHSKEMDALFSDPEAFYKTLASQSTSSTSTATVEGKRVKNTPAQARKKGAGSNPSADKTLSKSTESTLRPLPTLPNSSISFSINGSHQGPAFEDIFSFLPLRREKGKGKGAARGKDKEREMVFDDGTLGYYPFISLFGPAKVRINAGPEFKYPPSSLSTPAPLKPTSDTAPTPAPSPLKIYRPLSDRYPEYLSELRAIDAQEERELREMKLAAALEAKLEAEAKAKVDAQQGKDGKAGKGGGNGRGKKAKMSASASPAPDRGSEPPPQQQSLEVPSLSASAHPLSRQTSSSSPVPHSGSQSQTLDHAVPSILSSSSISAHAHPLSRQTSSPRPQSPLASVSRPMTPTSLPPPPPYYYAPGFFQSGNGNTYAPSQAHAQGVGVNVSVYASSPLSYAARGAGLIEAKQESVPPRSPQPQMNDQEGERVEAEEKEQWGQERTAEVRVEPQAYPQGYSSPYIMK